MVSKSIEQKMRYGMSCYIVYRETICTVSQPTPQVFVYRCSLFSD